MSIEDGMPCMETVLKSAELCLPRYIKYVSDVLLYLTRHPNDELREKMIQSAVYFALEIQNIIRLQRGEEPSLKNYDIFDAFADSADIREILYGIKDSSIKV